MPNNDTSPIISPEGEFGSVPSSNLKEALNQGFTVPTSDQIHEEAERQVYGAHPGMAAAAGALKGALPFGVGASLLTNIGASPEIQEKLVKYNPTSSVAGELGGAFAPGTGIAKVAARASKLAAGLTGLVGLGEDAGVAGKIATTLARGAAEGATFGTSNVVNDAVVGDPQVVAQQALSEIGTSALWGAGLGGAFKLAGSLPEGLQAAKGALSKVSDVAGLSEPLEAIKNAGKEAFASISAPISKVPKEKIMETFANLGREEGEAKAADFVSSLQDMHQTVESALRGAVKEFDDLTPETQSAMSDYLQSVDSSKGNGDFAKQFMYKSRGQLKIDPVKVETFLKNTNSARGIKGAEAFSNYFDSASNLLEKLSNEHALGPSNLTPDSDNLQELISKNKDLLQQQQDAALAQKLTQKYSGKAGGVGEGLGVVAVGHLLGIPTPLVTGAASVFEVLRNPIETINKLGELQQTISKSAKQLGNLADAVASSSQGISPIKGFAAGKIAADDKKSYTKITEQIQSLNQDIEGTTNKIHDNTAGLEQHAPAVVDAMRQTAGRAISFLASKIPQTSDPGPLARKPEPSGTQIAHFNEYYQAVENPLVIMKQAAEGTLTQESLEAVATVHPALFTQIKQALMSSLSDNKKAKDMPYHKKMMISLLLGQNLDGSLAPQSIQANQMQLEVANQQAQQKEQAFIGRPKPTSKGMREISISERALTAQQATAQRSGA